MRDHTDLWNSFCCCLPGTLPAKAARTIGEWLGPKRDGVWRETGILEKIPPADPKFAGATALEGVIPGCRRRRQGVRYRPDPVQGASNPRAPSRRNTRVDGKERIVCLDEAKGR